MAAEGERGGWTGLSLADGWDLIVEDDGTVAYAYLLHHEKIVTHVWLYNVVPGDAVAQAPDAPIVAPEAFIARPTPRRLMSAEDFDVRWEPAERTALLLIDGAVWAILRDGVNPGWCAGAAKDGPVARAMPPRGATAP